jgi:hypothetical protein
VNANDEILGADENLDHTEQFRLITVIMAGHVIVFAALLVMTWRDPVRPMTLDAVHHETNHRTHGTFFPIPLATNQPTPAGWFGRALQAPIAAGR